jgi:hypothetical protein
MTSLGERLLPVPVRVRLAGFRTVYDPRAMAVQVTAGGMPPSENEEMARRVRIMAGNCQHLALFCRLLPRARRRLGPAAQMFCHKFLRVAGPAFLAGLAASNVALLAGREATHRGLYGAALAAQGVFYALAWAGPRLAARTSAGLSPFLTLPRYFVMLNAAAAVGAYRFFFRAGRVAWGARETGAAAPRE